MAAVILDNLPPAKDRRRSLARPLLLMRTDDDAPEHWPRAGRDTRWTDADKRAAWALIDTSRAPAYEARMRGVGHMNFSDRALFEPGRFPSALDPQAALRIVGATMLSFLDRHVRGMTARSVDTVDGVLGIFANREAG